MKVKTVLLTAIFLLAQSNDKGNKKLLRVPKEASMVILLVFVIGSRYFHTDSFKQLKIALHSLAHCCCHW
jgi:hypothetical protein